MSAPNNTVEHAQKYIGLGWGLCSIPPGTKGPTDAGWNEPRNVIKTPWQAMSIVGARARHGIGLVHAASGTCAIDVDDLPAFELCLAELGLDVAEIFAGAPRIIGKPGRDKAVFKLPPGEFSVKKIVWPPRAPGEKPVTVFELRAGAVQDVLPPSIHPDTHEPYRWREGHAPWDTSIPELPAPIVAMWQAWDSIKPQLMAACPWAPKEEKAAAPKPRTRSSGDHDDVIGQFNQAHDVIAILENNGYVRKGKRWLSPTSSSKLAGVGVFDDRTHCYSHHASDPLNDGHAHDAFGVFCILSHNGDFTAAVKDAAELLGLREKWPPEAVQMVEPMPDSFFEGSRKRKAAPANVDPVPDRHAATPGVVERIEAMGVPSELLRVPGVLGEVVDMTNRTAPYPQPILSVQAALALGSVVLGRRYVSTRDNFTSLYFVNVAKSGMGKNHARTVIERTLETSGLDSLIGPPDFTSQPAVMSAMMRSPCSISIMDEFGDMLAYAGAKGNAQKGMVITTLKELWGKLDGTHRPAQYSEEGLKQKDRDAREQRIVRKPALSLLGMATPGQFYGALNVSAIEGGFLNRLIIAEATGPRTLPRKADKLEIPASVLAWCKMARSERGGGNLATMDTASMEPATTVVEFTRDAEALLLAYAEKIIHDQNTLEKESEALAEMVSRSQEKAMRLGVILACSVNIERPVITADVIRWAIAYVQWTTEKTIDAVQRHMTTSPFGELYKTILALFEGTDDRGLTDREIAQRSRTWRGTDPNTRERLLKAMRADGHIDLVETTGRTGQKRKAWTIAKYVSAPLDVSTP
ncbi:DUF3987 domain-containing protein [Dyella caseinilytica]|uniref:DUF3987 domain-containing protein n=1 Tax=Dyella caseinilytica TaxID=1849581 RepID=A0ABX7GPT3_9GAMM|nr:DUF3987 domain-containing protein [Dyella caseinilytica]QRN52412.1 DUF3987 domain-containing protein [Dyella caseinilytica]GGA05765.1 hypothetical protein GCM10011408_28380 [Dyella caseinilytica]